MPANHIPPPGAALSSYNADDMRGRSAALSGALEGFYALLYERTAVVCPVPADVDGAAQGLHDALLRIADYGLNRIVRTNCCDGGMQDAGMMDALYYILQYNIEDIAERIHNYTARKAAFGSKEVQGDVMPVLTFNPAMRILLDEHLHTAASRLADRLRGYSKEVPAQCFIYDDGHPYTIISGNRNDFIAKGTWLFFDSTNTDYQNRINKWYVALIDKPQGTYFNDTNIKELDVPEYAKTWNKITYIVGGDKGFFNYDDAALLSLYKQVWDYLFHQTLYLFYSHAEQEYEMNANMNRADALVEDILFILHSPHRGRYGQNKNHCGINCII
jgi:hypothetical protein